MSLCVFAQPSPSSLDPSLRPQRSNPRPAGLSSFKHSPPKVSTPSNNQYRFGAGTSKVLIGSSPSRHQLILERGGGFPTGISLGQETHSTCWFRGELLPSPHAPCFTGFLVYTTTETKLGFLTIGGGWNGTWRWRRVAPVPWTIYIIQAARISPRNHGY